MDKRTETEIRTQCATEWKWMSNAQRAAKIAAANEMNRTETGPSGSAWATRKWLTRAGVAWK